MLPVHIHIVSDSTGETGLSLSKAALAQFTTVSFQEHLWSLIRSEEQLRVCFSKIHALGGLVMCTLVNPILKDLLTTLCRGKKLPFITLLDPLTQFLTHHLGTPSSHNPGRQHTLDAAYFARIDAMQFAIALDDGQEPERLKEADVILVGVSRTSKTPTCLYLAHRGIKAANIPFVAEVPFSPSLLETLQAETPPVVGLTHEPRSLSQIRQNREQKLAHTSFTQYAHTPSVRHEVEACRRFCHQHGWPVVDVTKRSIEETVALIVQHLEDRAARA